MTGHFGSPGAPTPAGLDAAETYRACAARIERLVDDSSARLLEPVGACPRWSVRDVLGHLVGIADDWSSGRLDRYATPSWTAVQVDSMAHLEIEALFARWRGLIDALDDVPAHAVLGAPWRWLAGDALCHEADLAETLGTPMPPLVAVQFGLDSIIPRWRAVLDAAAAPPLEIRPTGLRPRPAGRVAGTGEIRAVVTTDPIELWRALYGRRRRDQIEAWSWTSDPAPWLDPGLPAPFTFPNATARTLGHGSAARPRSHG